MTSPNDQWLSRILFNAREIASMYFDVVKSRTGKEDTWLKGFISEVDQYRESRGWNKYGFGDEKESPSHLTQTLESLLDEGIPTSSFINHEYHAGYSSADYEWRKLLKKMIVNKLSK